MCFGSGCCHERSDGGCGASYKTPCPMADDYENQEYLREREAEWKADREWEMDYDGDDLK